MVLDLQVLADTKGCQGDPEGGVMRAERGVVQAGVFVILILVSLGVQVYSVFGGSHEASRDGKGQKQEGVHSPRTERASEESS